MAIKLYCLDTSVLIESWWRLYRPSSFPSFWLRMEDAIGEGYLIAPEIVLKELEKKEGDELYTWAQGRVSMFQPLNVELQTTQSSIINQFPKLIDEAKGRSFGDPWVIALAQINQCPVVTEENPGGYSKPKIPDVCNQLGIGCMKIADLIETLGWTF